MDPSAGCRKMLFGKVNSIPVEAHESSVPLPTQNLFDQKMIINSQIISNDESEALNLYHLLQLSGLPLQSN